MELKPKWKNIARQNYRWTLEGNMGYVQIARSLENDGWRVFGNVGTPFTVTHCDQTFKTLAEAQAKAVEYVEKALDEFNAKIAKRIFGESINQLNDIRRRLEDEGLAVSPNMQEAMTYLELVVDRLNDEWKGKPATDPGIFDANGNVTPEAAQDLRNLDDQIKKVAEKIIADRQGFQINDLVILKLTGETMKVVGFMQLGAAHRAQLFGDLGDNNTYARLESKDGEIGVSPLDRIEKVVTPTSVPGSHVKVGHWYRIDGKGAVYQVTALNVDPKHPDFGPKADLKDMSGGFNQTWASRLIPD